MRVVGIRVGIIMRIGDKSDLVAGMAESHYRRRFNVMSGTVCGIPRLNRIALNLRVSGPTLSISREIINVYTILGKPIYYLYLYIL